MDRNYRQAIEALFDKLATVERQSPPRDGESEAFIRDKIARQPGAPYYMAQTIVIQEQALAASEVRLAELEASIMSTINTLEIGAMGFGGNVTLIGCKIGALNRLPASFFVSVAYDCWAYRRLGVVLDATSGEVTAVELEA